jgi:diguanylate cyclase (GGDEF)-like protein
VVLPDTELASAVSIAQAIDSAVAGLALCHQGSEVSEFVSVSIGVASLTPSEALNYEDLVQQADTALYAAKQRGRNRYHIYTA